MVDLGIEIPEGHSLVSYAERPDLVDVIFSGGLLRHWDGTATLFAGISDAEAAFLHMPDPMLELEAETSA